VVLSQVKPRLNDLVVSFGQDIRVNLEPPRDFTETRLHAAVIEFTVVVEVVL